MKKILYVSYTRLEYSLNAVYIKGLRENGIEVLCFKLPSRGIRGHLTALNFIRDNKTNSDALIIGYDSSALAVFLRLFYRGKMIFCAVLPIYERLVISRNLVSRWSLRGGYYWLIDFLAFHLSDLTMVESNQQICHISKYYFMPKDKLLRAWIGINEENFYYDLDIKKFDTFTVLFRGALMPEAGAEYVVQAAKILEKDNIDFIMLSGGMLLGKINELIEGLQPRNLKINSNFLSSEELRVLMQKCHLSLGQMSDHPRLERTIPHKCYESLAMKLSYLTASNKGVLELLRDGEICITCEPANVESLAGKILWAKNNYPVVQKIAENGYRFYENELRSDILAKNLLNNIF